MKLPKPTYNHNIQPNNPLYKYINERYWAGTSKLLNNMCKVLGHDLKMDRLDDKYRKLLNISGNVGAADALCVRCSSRIVRVWELK